MPGGRPRKYETAEELQKAIEDYFENGVNRRDVVVGKGENAQVVSVPVPTITGLVIHLGFCDRHSFYDLEKMDEFSHTVKRARTLMEMKYEELLVTQGGSGPIFALKNFGWKDKSIVENTGLDGGPLQVAHSVTDSMKELLGEVYESKDSE